MKELEVVVLEDGIEYAIIDKIRINGEDYIYLANTNDEKDFCIRKMKETETERHIIGLDSDEEFNYILTLFVEE